MKHKNLLILVILLGSVGGSALADNGEFADEFAGTSGIVLNKYLQATQIDPLKGSAMQVSIDASVPRLNEHGTLTALRKISAVGKITYRVLGFQGDKSVKSDVIGRYLQAEQQGQNDQNLTVSPANYKFRFKGKKQDDSGNERYVFQLLPRSKRVGLFKGELWLDASTYLPVVEKGRLVKNPSVFFRKVDFERDFSIRNGLAVPAQMSSVIDTRLVGKVNLSVTYSQVALNPAETEDIAENAVQTSSNNLP